MEEFFYLAVTFISYILASVFLSWKKNGLKGLISTIGILLLASYSVYISTELGTGAIRGIGWILLVIPLIVNWLIVLVITNLYLANVNKVVITVLFVISIIIDIVIGFVFERSLDEVAGILSILFVTQIILLAFILQKKANSTLKDSL